MRAVIYARYSSDQQNDRSIDDQLRLCREYAVKLGAEVVAVYSDQAMSGAHLKSRPAIVRLMAAARERGFDAVIAEGLDRLSRDQEDVAGIYKRLCFAQIALITVAEGIVTELHVGLKGTMNALFIRDLAAKVRRGQAGRAADGLVAGGIAYGYDVVREFDAKGAPVRGKRRINPEQAAVVRRIVAAYVAGESARAIVTALNRDGIKAPGGGKWNVSTVQGNRGRGIGVLWNEAYAGQLVYNRLTMVKDPETGRRLSRPNPPEAWIRVPAPDLRIVPDDLWQAVQARQAASAGRPMHLQRRPRHLFSGLVRCGLCGRAYSIKSKDRLACTAHRDQGTCGNARTIRFQTLETRVLQGIRRALLTSDALAEFVKEFHAERRRIAAGGSRRREQLEAQVPALDKRIGNIVDAIAEGLASPAMKTKLTELERDRAAAVAELATLGDSRNVVDVHPAAVGAYHKALEDLQHALTADDRSRAEASALLRRAVAAIEIHPGLRRGEVKITVRGIIEELIGLAALPNENKTGPRRTANLVAGEGFGQYRPTIAIAC